MVTLQSIMRFIKKALINGLLTLLPITLTIGLFALSARLIIGWLEPIQYFMRHPIATLTEIPYGTLISQLFGFLLFVFIIGVIVKALLLRQLIDLVEDVISKIPIVRPIYSGTKQLVQAFSTQDKESFKQVVMVEFPRTGMYSIGFMTSELSHSIAPNIEKRMYNIFIPTTPNPTSGFFVIAPEDSFIPLDITRQEAMSLILSSGIIQPGRFTK